jgi:hypothetical protein
MRCLPLALLALAGLVPATAYGRIEVRDVAAFPIALDEPRPGAPLAAGARTWLAWQPLDGFGDFEGVDEWEAFLSLDGGATYPLRITPELDLDLRRVSWRVPSLPSDGVRLLLHFGGRAADGERFEVAVELPQSFRIDATPAASTVPPRWVLGRGQVALPGQSGAVGWVEGSRRGERLREVVAVDFGAGLAGYRPFELGDHGVELETVKPADGACAAAPVGRAPPPASARADGRRLHPIASRQILLQTSRLNE